ncbi:MAG: hypothetical protein GDA37_07165 [Ekhidna sp.]|nr:hypothetical protein [Ekhidna sp.]
MSLTVPNGTTERLTLRGSFTTAVEDNEQVAFMLAGATAQTAGSSQFKSPLTGGTSATTGDANKIEVIATTYAFAQQPSNVNQCVPMSPAVQVEAVDGNGNRDLDYTEPTGVEITSSSSAIRMSPVAVGPFMNGIGTAGDIIHEAPVTTGVTLTVTGNLNGGTSVVSDPFDVLPFNMTSDAQIVAGGETNNIIYAANQQTNLTSSTDGVSLASIDITDAGGDRNPTILTELTLTVTNCVV